MPNPFDDIARSKAAEEAAAAAEQKRNVEQEREREIRLQKETVLIQERVLINLESFLKKTSVIELLAQLAEALGVHNDTKLLVKYVAIRKGKLIRKFYNVAGVGHPVEDHTSELKPKRLKHLLRHKKEIFERKDFDNYCSGDQVIVIGFSIKFTIRSVSGAYYDSGMGAVIVIDHEGVSLNDERVGNITKEEMIAKLSDIAKNDEKQAITYFHDNTP